MSAEAAAAPPGEGPGATASVAPLVRGGRTLPDEVVRFASLTPEQRRLLMHVHELLSEISFGTVVLVMQDGAVIQVETSEKIRLR